MSETTHTPTPWEAQERDNRERGIAIIAVYPDAPKGRGPTRGMVAWVGQAGANFGKPAVQKANADFIITAVNHHAELVEALRAVTDRMDRAGGDRDGMPECPWCKAGPDGDDHASDCELAAARALLARIKEGA